MTVASVSRRYSVAAATLLITTLLVALYWQAPSLNAEFLRVKEDRPSNDELLLASASNRTLGFQKIFMMILPSRTDIKDAASLAAAYTGLDIQMVDGVVGSLISDKALPPGTKEAEMRPGELGCWRAHMNVAQMIVEQNLASALVLEGDADWDVRIKYQMHRFAKASRLLLQPRRDNNDSFLDPTKPRWGDEDKPTSFDADDTYKHSEILSPTSSPYGDLERWDLLWLGHCGSRLPSVDSGLPLARVVIANDETVPERQHVDAEYGEGDFLDEYPAHSRLVARAQGNICTLGYALSQAGARRLLHGLGLKRFDGPLDWQLDAFCEGLDGRPNRNCLTVLPQLFTHHRRRGNPNTMGDIGDYDEEIEHAFSHNTRYSARLNLGRLIDDKELLDSYPDGTDETHWSEDDE